MQILHMKKTQTNRNSLHVFQFLTYLIIECEELEGKEECPRHHRMTDVLICKKKEYPILFSNTGRKISRVK